MNGAHPVVTIMGPQSSTVEVPGPLHPFRPGRRGHPHTAQPMLLMKRASLGQRHTRQRDVIVEVIDGAPGPLTVGEILARAQRKIPTLGIATVYRTIKLLQDHRQVETVILPTGETRYESSGLGHHHHFHCRVCQEVFDVDACPVSLAPDAVVGRGYRVERHELTLYGTCPDCSA